MQYDCFALKTPKETKKTNNLIGIVFNCECFKLFRNFLLLQWNACISTLKFVFTFSMFGKVKVQPYNIHSNIFQGILS